jgi:hypothetical protein
MIKSVIWEKSDTSIDHYVVRIECSPRDAYSTRAAQHHGRVENGCYHFDSGIMAICFVQDLPLDFDAKYKIRCDAPIKIKFKSDYTKENLGYMLKAAKRSGYRPHIELLERVVRGEHLHGIDQPMPYILKNGYFLIPGLPIKIKVLNDNWKINSW